MILAVRAREAFSIAEEVSHSVDIFCSKIMVGLYTVIQEMSSFPMSVANIFCDLPLSKYLDKNCPNLLSAPCMEYRQYVAGRGWGGVELTIYCRSLTLCF